MLSNDRDIEASALTASLQTGPANGTLTGPNTDGSFSYTPTGAFTGSDSFTYTLSDGTLTDTVTVNIDVLQPVSISNVATDDIENDPYNDPPEPNPTSPSLYVEQNEEYDNASYLKFSLAGFSGTYTSIDLQLNVQDGYSALPIDQELYLTADTWSESNFGSLPAAGALVTGWQYTGNGLMTVDVASAVQAAVDNGDSEINFVIQGTFDNINFDGGYSSYSSKDDANPALRPTLLFAGGVANHVAPTTSSRAVSTNEDAPYAFSADDFPFSDADSDPFDAVQVDSLPTAGTLMAPELR